MIVPSARQCTVCGAERLRALRDLLRLEYMMKCWLTGVRCIHEMDSARSDTGQDDEPTRLAWFAVATAAGIPTEMVKLVAHMRHGQTADHLAVSGRGRIHVDRCQVIGVCRLLGTHIDGGHVEDRFAR